MTDLLTRAEYAAIAGEISFPSAPFIDGKFRKGRGAMMPTLNPATGEELTRIATASARDVDLAVEKARGAFDQGRWAKTHPTERKEVLIRLARLITRNRRELAVMESLECGKPIRDCEAIDIPETVACIR